MIPILQKTQKLRLKEVKPLHARKSWKQPQLCAWEARPVPITLPASWDTSDPIVQSTKIGGAAFTPSVPRDVPRKATQVTMTIGKPATLLH